MDQSSCFLECSFHHSEHLIWCPRAHMEHWLHAEHHPSLEGNPGHRVWRETQDTEAGGKPRTQRLEGNPAHRDRSCLQGLMGPVQRRSSKSLAYGGECSKALVPGQGRGVRTGVTEGGTFVRAPGEWAELARCRRPCGMGVQSVGMHGPFRDVSGLGRPENG